MLPIRDLVIACLHRDIFMQRWSVKTEVEQHIHDSDKHDEDDNYINSDDEF